ncbi:MAG TPA: APC family permease [Candidatus Dormibacteraeota bacterium]|nr:APC family permease [Candidatus Dormibacteraeota bacterium]
MTDTLPEPSGPAEVHLADDEVKALREAGRAWSRVPRARAPDGAFVDPDLDTLEKRGRPGEHYVRVVRSKTQGFERVAPGWLQATARATAPTGEFGRLRGKLRLILLGAPLATEAQSHERLTKIKALAVLSSDALSSVAYAPEQIVFFLAMAGAAAYGYVLPITFAISLLLVIVVLSYRQTIKAYPKGGGSYIVASDNLGPLAGLVAGCALMTSYTLTVAVSVAAGTDNIISAAPGVIPYRVPLCLGFIALLLFGNLRGIRESGSIFAAPTYLFVASMFLMVIVAGVQIVVHHVPYTVPVIDPRRLTQNLGIILVLRAFASGATALTGVEAISDGVPAFKPKEWVNARTTLTTLGVILGTMFVGISLVTYWLGLVPDLPSSPHYQTVISKIAAYAFANGPLYFFVIVSTIAILVLAGNTAFSDFPRLLFFMARDDYAPHQFKRLGDRLSYSNGIIALAAVSGLLVWLFNGNVTSLLPLYAVGVFTAFTMSQAGMVSRWLRLRTKGWRLGLAMNATGTVITGLVLAINGITRFLDGAGVIVIIVPLLVAAAFSIHRHYKEVSSRLTTEIPTSPDQMKLVCLVPIADLNSLALQSLALARSLSENVIAVHVCDDEHHIAMMRARWEAWGNHVPLEIVESPYRSFVRPLLRYIDAIDKQRSDDTVIIVLPELVATRWWHQLLHNQTALRLKAQLLFRPGTVVVNVPYHLQHAPHARRLRRRGAGGDNNDIEAI